MAASLQDQAKQLLIAAFDALGEQTPAMTFHGSPQSVGPGTSKKPVEARNRMVDMVNKTGSVNLRFNDDMYTKRKIKKVLEAVKSITDQTAVQSNTVQGLEHTKYIGIDIKEKLTENDIIAANKMIGKLTPPVQEQETEEEAVARLEEREDSEAPAGPSDAPGRSEGTQRSTSTAAVAAQVGPAMLRGERISPETLKALAKIDPSLLPILKKQLSKKALEPGRDIEDTRADLHNIRAINSATEQLREVALPVKDVAVKKTRRERTKALPVRAAAADTPTDVPVRPRYWPRSSPMPDVVEARPRFPARY